MYYQVGSSWRSRYLDIFLLHELTISFTSAEYTESITFVESTKSKAIKSKATSKATSKKTQMIQLIRELNTPFRRENENNNINNNNRNNNSGDMLLLIHLYTNIICTERDASKANQMVIRSWYEFANELEN